MHIDNHIHIYIYTHIIGSSGARTALFECLVAKRVPFFSVAMATRLTYSLVGDSSLYTKKPNGGKCHVAGALRHHHGLHVEETIFCGGSVEKILNHLECQRANVDVIEISYFGNDYYDSVDKPMDEKDHSYLWQRLFRVVRQKAGHRAVIFVGGYAVSVVSKYIHLGGLTHRSGDLRKEIRRRIGIAHQSFSKHRKLLFQNKSLELTRRVEIFNSLILSRLLYGSETWCIHEQRTRDFLHGAVIRLYKRLLQCDPDAHVPDEAVLHGCGLPSPSDLLRLKRLSYLGSLMSAGPSAHWGLLNQDQEWMDLIRADLSWMWDHLHHACSLGNPFDHPARWIEIIRHHRGYWKRLIRRTQEHARLRVSRQFLCVQSHLRIWDFVQEKNIGSLSCPRTSSRPSPSSGFGCMLCRMTFSNLAGERAHMFKVHGHSHPVRTLIGGTQCSACLKEYFTTGKLKAHLLRSHPCRQLLLGRNFQCNIEPGPGSSTDQARHADWDGNLPPLQAAGPLVMPGPLRDFPSEDVELYQTLALILVEVDTVSVDQLADRIIDTVLATAISWSSCRHMFIAFKNTLDADEMGITCSNLELLTAMLDRLLLPSTWSFLTSPSARSASSWPALSDVEDSFLHGKPSPVGRPPPQICRERIFLHFFSGRRRPGDLQHYMDLIFAKTCMDGTLLQVVSLDLMIDKELGDVRKPTTQTFWRNGVKSGWVLGALCGPPCETWSQARFVETHQGMGHGPRPLRSASDLWGLPSLPLKECQQVAAGNELLMFAVEILYYLYDVGGFGVLEHPEEPDDVTRPSIWRLSVLRFLCTCPGVTTISLSQGLWGAATPKPTRLLAINLPELGSCLRSHQITTELPMRSAIGRDVHGGWRTSPLKEYPPALNRGFAVAFCRWFRCVSSKEDHISVCRTMTISAFGSTIGPDYGA